MGLGCVLELIRPTSLSYLVYNFRRRLRRYRYGLRVCAHKARVWVFPSPSSSPFKLPKFRPQPFPSLPLPPTRPHAYHTDRPPRPVTMPYRLEFSTITQWSTRASTTTRYARDRRRSPHAISDTHAHLCIVYTIHPRSNISR